jgi:hypothetical protein
LLAVGWFQKRLLGVVMRDDRLWVVGWTKGVVPPIVLASRVPRPALRTRDKWLPMLVGGQLSHRGPERALYFIDDTFTLWRLRLSAPFGLERHEEAVYSLSESPEFGVVFTTETKVHTGPTLEDGFIDALNPNLIPRPRRMRHQFFPMLGGAPISPRCLDLLHAGGQILQDIDSAGGVLRRVSESPSSSQPINLPERASRLGLTADPKREMAPAVLVHDLATRTLRLVTADGPRDLLQLDGEPQALTLSPSRLELAWIDHEGQLVHYDYNKDQELRRLRPSELP